MVYSQTRIISQKQKASTRNFHELGNGHQGGGSNEANAAVNFGHHLGENLKALCVTQRGFKEYVARVGTQLEGVMAAYGEGAEAA